MAKSCSRADLSLLAEDFNDPVWLTIQTEENASNNNKGLDVQDQQDLCMQSVLPGTGPGGHGQVVLDGGGGEGYNCPYQ